MALHLTLLLAAGAALAQAAPPPLNVVVIDVCSARADHFGAYGYKKDVTPGLDAAAKDGVLFENAMAQSSWCLSNYASLFTGHTPEVHGVYAMAPRTLPKDQATVTQRMKEAGYDTAAYSGGTWMLPDWGLNRGFDHYINTLSTGAALTAFAKKMPEMLDWVSSRAGRPFFLYASIEDLHIPYSPDLHVLEEPNADGVTLDGGRRAPLLRGADGAPPKKSDPPAPEPGLPKGRSRALPELVSKYDASLGRADRQISLFLSKLKEKGLWDKTVVIVTGDHGESLGEHGLTGHMEGLYQPMLHVPLIMHHPGYPQLKGRRYPQLVQRIDLAPTLLDIASQPYGDMELQGASLMTLLENPAAPWREYAFAASKRSTQFAKDFVLDERVVRTKRWKLHWYMQRNRYELYDLETDPLEENDLAAKRPDVVANLSFELIRHLELSRPHAPGLPSGKTPAAPAALERRPPAE
ncbi:MAG: sulfatase [Elusimicrobia bacterium]|nr:sulfatase [Elusimicrobiota bacterium]